MGLSIDEMLRRHFALASLRQMAKTVDNPDTWRRARIVMERGRRLRTRAKDLFESAYQRRLDAERLRRIDEAGELNRTLAPKWAATDGFDPDRTRALAEQAVRLAHERRIALIESAEAKLLAKLLPKRAEVLSQTPRQIFNRRARDGPQQG